MIFQLFSEITPPVTKLTPPPDGAGAVIILLNFVLKIVFFAAGLYSFWNFVVAGYTLVGSGGEAKSLESARDKLIWTFVGLLVMVGAVVIAGLIGMIVYGKWDAIINPKFTNTVQP